MGHCQLIIGKFKKYRRAREARDKERRREFDYSTSSEDAASGIHPRQPEMMKAFAIPGQLSLHLGVQPLGLTGLTLLSIFQRSDHCMSKIIIECHEHLHRHVVSTVEASDCCATSNTRKVISRPLLITT